MARVVAGNGQSHVAEIVHKPSQICDSAPDVVGGVEAIPNP
jgi:hypothetical protein